jgi:hypothetical protein
MLQHDISNTADIDAEIADMADRISELRTRIADLEEHMRTLRTHRNAQSLLCRLPTDALLCILSSLAHADHESCVALARSQFELIDWSRRQHWCDMPDRPRNGIAVWVHITRVCTHIRRFALHAPLLWRNVEYNREGWSQLCLQRSESLPIFASVRGFSDRLSNLYGPVYVSAHRMQHLSIHVLDKDSETSAIAFLNTSFPLLESLSYSGVSGFKLADKFLGGDPPRLTTLVLTNGALGSNTPSLPELTHLSLGFMKLRGGLEVILSLLEKTPKLMELFLGRLALVSKPKPQVSLTHVSVLLPRLESVRLYNNGVVTHHVLLGLPDPLRLLHIVDLAIDSDSQLLTSDYDLFRATNDRVRDWTQRRGLALRAIVGRSEQHRSGLLDVRLWVPDTGTTLPIMNEERRTDMVLHCTASCYRAALIIRETADIELSPHALQRFAKNGHLFDVKNIIFPSLVSLALKDVHILVMNDDDLAGQRLRVRGLGDSPAGAWSANIISWLRSRSEVGYRVQILKLLGITEFTEAITRFAKLVEASNVVDEAHVCCSAPQ